MLKRIPSPTRRLAAALALAILAACALPVLAQDADLEADGPDIAGLAARPGGDDGDDFAPGFPARLARRLELTDAQQDAIAKIHEAGRARDLPLRKQARLVRHELQGEMMKDAPAEKTVLALAKQANDLRGQIQAGRLLDRLAVRKLLTPEQCDKLLAIGGMGGGFGPGGPGREGMGPRGAFLRGERGQGRHDGAWDRMGEGRRVRRHQADRNTD